MNKDKGNTVKQFQDAIQKFALEKQPVENTELQLRAVMQTSIDAIIMSDTSGNILSWNNGAKQLFKYEEEEVIGKSLTILIPDKYKKPHNEGIERVKNTGVTRIIGKTVEVEGIDKYGKVFPIALSLSSWQFEGEMYFGGIIRDITENKKYQTTLLENEAKLKQKNKLLEKANKEVAAINTQLQALSAKLSKYLPTQLYNSIFTGNNSVKIEAFKKKLTVCFSDVVGFTSNAEIMPEHEFSSWLNTYLNCMAEIIIKHEGTLDKFIGDAVMVFFGDPETAGEKDDAIKCVKMAIDMLHKAKELNIDIRVGINSGECTVGNFGCESRMDYTIVGGVVNLASRLESNSEPGRILISEATYALIKDEIDCTPRGRIHVKGIHHEIMTYWVTGCKDCNLPVL